MTRKPGHVSAHSAARDGQDTTGHIAGRRRELRQLDQLLSAAFAGRGSLAIISGEAGIGKTTLVTYLAERADSQQAFLLTGHCYDLETTPPYGPWLETIRSHAAAGLQPEPPEILTRAAVAGPTSTTIDLVDELRSFYFELASRQLLVIILEDQHWADPASLEFLRYFARQISGRSILVVLTYRDTELLPGQPLYSALPHLVREAPAVRIPLRPLDTQAIHELIVRRFPLTNTDQDRLAAYLQQYAEGNPFFIEELLITLEYEGALQPPFLPDQMTWRLATLTEVEMPSLVRQIISSAIARLEESTLQLLQIAAVLGSEVPIHLWQHVASTGEDELFSAIAEALTARVLVETSQPDILRFRHALIRETLYSDLLLPRRRAWHRAAGEALAAMPNPDPDLVAHHFRQAGADELAVTWLIRAGGSATATFAYQTAARRYEQALEFLERDDSRLQEQGWLLCFIAESYRYTNTRRSLQYINQARDLLDLIDDPALSAVVLRTRSHMRGMLGENGLAELDEAIAIYESLSEADRQRIADSPVGYTASTSIYAQRLAYYGQYAKARQLAYAYLAEVDHHESPVDPDILGINWLCIGMAEAGLGNPAAARRAYSMSRDYFAQVNNAYQAGLAYTWEYTTVLHIYYPHLVEERRRYIQSAEERFAQSVYADLSGDEQPLLLFVARLLTGDWQAVLDVATPLLTTDSMKIECGAVVAEIYRRRGDYAQAQTLIDRSLPAGPSFGPSTPYYRETIEIQRTAAELALDQRQLDRARLWIDAYRAWVEWASLATGKATLELLESRHAEVSGDHQAAVEHASLALERATVSGEPLVRLGALRALGRLATGAGDLKVAGHHLESALEIANRIQGPYEIALTNLEVAALRLQQGDAAIARELLDAVKETARELEAAPLLQQAEDLLQQTAGALRNPADSFGLSPRQIDVLRLIVDGQTDREIAEELFISPRTVMNHVSAILNKMGVNSRTAAAAEAVRRGIV